MPREEEGVIGSRDQNITKGENETPPPPPDFQGNVRGTQRGEKKREPFLVREQSPIRDTCDFGS